MNTNSDKVFRARRVITPTGEVAASVVVRDGRIAEITPYDAPHAAGEIIDVPDDSALLPGLVDSHVHVNEPGRTEWEGFATATRAAAAGGITTLIDMPLNSIPATVDIAALREKQDVAAGQCSIDVGFWGGAVGDNHDGRTLRGVVRSTWLRGDLITGDQPRGRLLRKAG